MTYLILFAFLVLIVQVVLFFYIRKRNRKFKEEGVLERYGIVTRKDAWQALSDPNLPEIDREEIAEFYKSTE